MYNNKEIVPTIDFGEEEYKSAVEILKKKKLERYYDNTEADTPKKNVKYFVDNISPTFGKAIDIGCGSGNDSVYLIMDGVLFQLIKKMQEKEFQKGQMLKNKKDLSFNNRILKT